jgi:hypothetical protein
MIKANSDDLQKLKELCPKDHLIIANSTYNGWRRILEFIATFIVNPFQLLRRRKYNNKELYIAHTFTIYHNNDSLWVGEMDAKEGWRENPIEKSNTFKKLYTGQIRLFDLGKIPENEFIDFLFYARKVRYTLIGAIASEFWSLRIFRSKKNLIRKRHCASVFVRYQPFFKYFETTGNQLLKEFGTHHPEAIDYYLCKNFDVKIVKVKKGKLVWN